MVTRKKMNTFVAENGANYKNYSYFALVFQERIAYDAFGKVLEWLKRHAWKACIRQKRIRGSNPLLSARGNGRRIVRNRVINLNSIN